MSLSLEDQAYSHLTRKMLRGQIAPGSVVSEAALAREMGVSRTPVRHAIRRLISQGCVELRPGMGTVVRTMSRHEVAEVWDLRRALEVMAAHRAAERISDRQVRQLRALHAQMKAVTARVCAGGPKAWTDEVAHRHLTADVGLHEVILAAADSPRLVQVMEGLRLLATLVVRGVDTVVLDLPRLCRQVDDEHGRIIEALARHDAPAARRAMDRHLRLGKRHHLAEFDAHAERSALSPDVRRLLEENTALSNPSTPKEE